MKLSELSYNDFKALIDFLTEDRVDNVIERLLRFFPSASALEIFDIQFAVNAIMNDDKDAEKIYKSVVESHPDTIVDSTGRSPIGPLDDFWEIRLKSLDVLYETALNELKNHNFADNSPHKINSQVYNGKKLSNLKNVKIEKSSYWMLKTLYFKNHPESIINMNSLKRAEVILDKLFNSHRILEKLLVKVSKKKYENYSLFAEHFFERLDILSHDPSLKNPSNREFFDNLKEANCD